MHNTVYAPKTDTTVHLTNGPWTFLQFREYPGLLSHLACGTGDATTDCSSSGVVDNYNITDSTTFTPAPGSWYNGVVIYHKGTVRIFINGSLISTKVGSGAQALL